MTDSRRSRNTGAKMEHILVMEDEEFLGSFFKESLEEKKYRVTLIANPEEARQVLKAGAHFDFVWSDGSGWHDCYTLAIELFGRERVLVYTASQSLLKELSRLGVTVFKKGATNQGLERHPSEVANEVQKLILRTVP